MPLFSRSRKAAEASPPPPGVVVEPLDAEGLLAILERFCDAHRGRHTVTEYGVNGWKVYGNGSVYDPGGFSRCVAICRDSAAGALDADGRYPAQVAAANVFALTVAAATDPADVDRIAGRD